jgi:Tol biopolymer transport system component
VLGAALIGGFLFAAPAQAQTFTFDLVSHAIDSPTTAGNFAEPVDFTPDGRFVLFRSAAETIAPLDANGVDDFFVYDTQDESVRLVTHTAASQTTTSNGELFDPDQGLFDPEFLPGGRYLFFRTTATDMAGTDTNGVQDFFLYDIQDGSLDLVSHSATSLTTTANGGVGLSTYQRISDDARYILLDSSATDMTTADLNGTAIDLYLYDTFDQGLALVSHSMGSLTTTTTDEISLGFLAPDGAHVLFLSLFPGNASFLPTNSAMLYRVADGSLLRLGSTNSQPITFSPDGRYAFYNSTEFQAGQSDPNGPDLLVRDTQDGSDELVNHAFGSLISASDRIAFAGLLGNANFAFSPDSRFIGFTTGATNVAQSDDNDVEDLFLYDVTDRSVAIVSHAFGQNTTAANAGPFGTPAGTGNGNRFSPNSRYLLFSSGSNNIAQSDSNGSDDTFIYDTSDESIAPLTRAFGTAAATSNGNATDSLWSPDSRYVYFISAASNLVAPGVDTNGDSDSFVYDTQDGSIDLVSHPVGAPATAAGALEFLAFSADGRHILLQTPRQNVAVSDPNLVNDIFLYDLLDQSLALVSHAANSPTTTGNGASTSASVSPDGRFVLFESSATDIAGTDANTGLDTFLYDVATGAVSLVTRTASGSTGNQSGVYSRFSPDGTLILIGNESSDLNGVTATDTPFPSVDLFLTEVPEPGPALLGVASGLTLSAARRRRRIHRAPTEMAWRLPA